MATIEKQQEFVDIAKSVFGDIKVISRAQVKELRDSGKAKWPSWLTSDESLRAGRGLYHLKLAASNPVLVKRTADVSTEPIAPTFTAPEDSTTVQNNNVSVMYLPGTEGEESLVPTRDKSFVPFGDYDDIKTILQSERFFPIMIAGMSGNGKTFSALQVCAELGRECIRANVTEETSEDDLLGGYRLLGGETVWCNGPATIAMERGAVLLLDEFDRGGNRLMALQPVLEGKPVYLKKVGRYVHPKPGFMVIATANTKGKGDDDGRYVSANVQDDALLERFPATFMQQPATMVVEKKILSKFCYSTVGTISPDVKDFIEKLSIWSDTIRKTYLDAGISEMITTRRLVRILEAYFIFQDRMKVVKLLVARFDDQTRESFEILYRAVEDPASTNTPAPTDESVASDPNQGY